MGDARTSGEGGAGPVRVWWAEVSEGAAAALEPYLSEHERSRAARFVRPVDRWRSIVGRGLARHVLAGALGLEPAQIRFALGPHGKPAIVSTGSPFVDFNVAHSGERALCALAHGRQVGVDVELDREVRERDGIIAGQFAAPERSALMALPPELRGLAFHRAWTRKEAALKALGLGIVGGLENAVVPCSADLCAETVAVTVARDGGRHGVRLWLCDVDIGRCHMAAVAFSGERAAVTVSRFYPPVRR